jgi:hypothetical protein
VGLDSWGPFDPSGRPTNGRDRDLVPTSSHVVPGALETTSSLVPSPKGDEDVVELVPDVVPGRGGGALSERLVTDALAEVLRPIVAELVAEELERHRDDHPDDHDSPPFLTVAQYAERHQATPAAVRARIRRGALEAIRPPGGREYLIPNDGQAGGHDG